MRPFATARFVLRLGALLLIGQTACVAPQPGPIRADTDTSPPPSAEDSATRAIRLLWAPAVDLDLYVTGPDAVTIYFGNPESRIGTLRSDIECTGRAASTGVAASERVDLGTIQSGTYRVGVDFSDACTGPVGPVAYRIIANFPGTTRAATGTLTAGEFRPDALVFSIPVSGDGAE